MTIIGAAYITAADQLQIHNANGYLRLTPALTLTLASDIIVPTQNYNKVATEGSTTTDTCLSITPTYVTEGFVLILVPNNTAHTITFTDTATPALGTLSLNGNFSMTGVGAALTLIYTGTDWVELSRTSPGSSGMTVGQVIALSMIFS